MTKKKAKKKKKKRTSGAAGKPGAKKAKKKKKMPEGRRWKPGQSGNPSGLPKQGLELRDAARSFTEEALETLVRVLRARPPLAKIKAAVAILDRGWGKPAQALQLSGPDGGPIQHTTQDLSKWSAKDFTLAKRLARKLDDPGGDRD